jgi:hypothetical protein
MIIYKDYITFNILGKEVNLISQENVLWTHNSFHTAAEIENNILYLGDIFPNIEAAIFAYQDYFKCTLTPEQINQVMIENNFNKEKEKNMATTTKTSKPTTTKKTSTKKATTKTATKTSTKKATAKPATKTSTKKTTAKPATKTSTKKSTAKTATKTSTKKTTTKTPTKKTTTKTPTKKTTTKTSAKKTTAKKPVKTTKVSSTTTVDSTGVVTVLPKSST